jgi:hypothetical protein
VPGYSYKYHLYDGDGDEVGVNDFMVERANAATTVRGVPLVWFCQCTSPDGMVSHLVDERACPICKDRRPV